MEDLTLIINNPENGNFLKEISWNKEEFEALVDEVLKNYDGITYTDDQINDAKKDRAKLNNLKKALEERRKDIKKEIMRPYDQFESEYRPIVSKIDEAVGKIGSAVTAYEEGKKAEKREKLESFFNEIGQDLKEHGQLSFEDVFNPQSLNATYSFAKAVDEIREKVDGCRRDLEAISGLDDSIRAVAQNTYMRTHDIATAMNEANRVRMIQERQAAEKAAREEADRLRAEAEAARERETLEAAGTTSENETDKSSDTTQKEHIEAQSATEQHADDIQQNAPEQKPVKMCRSSFRIVCNGEELAKIFNELQRRGIESYVPNVVLDVTLRGEKDNLLGFRDFLIENEINYGKPDSSQKEANA